MEGKNISCKGYEQLFISTNNIIKFIIMHIFTNTR